MMERLPIVEIPHTEMPIFTEDDVQGVYEIIKKVKRQREYLCLPVYVVMKAENDA